MRDLILAVRADEANHRDVNHAFAALNADATNPFIQAPGPAAPEAASGKATH